jgi:hypothetical protein
MFLNGDILFKGDRGINIILKVMRRIKSDYTLSGGIKFSFKAYIICLNHNRNLTSSVPNHHILVSSSKSLIQVFKRYL